MPSFYNINNIKQTEITQRSFEILNLVLHPCAFFYAYYFLIVFFFSLKNLFYLELIFKQSLQKELIVPLCTKAHIMAISRFVLIVLVIVIIPDFTANFPAYMLTAAKVKANKVAAPRPWDHITHIPPL